MFNRIDTGLRGRIGKDVKTIRTKALSTVLVLGLALGGATAITATTSVVMTPEAQAFGLSDIGGAIKKVGGAVKGAAKTVAKDIKNTSKIVGGEVKEIGKEMGRFGKEFGQDVGGDIKRAGKAVGRGTKWVGKRVGGSVKLMGDDIAIGFNYLRDKVPCPYNGRKCSLKRTGVDREVGYDPSAQPGRGSRGIAKRLRVDSKLPPPRRSGTVPPRRPTAPVPKPKPVSGNHDEARMPPARSSERRLHAGCHPWQNMCSRPKTPRRKDPGPIGKRPRGEAKLPPARGGKPVRKVQGITKENLKPKAGRTQASKRPVMRDRSVWGRPVGTSQKPDVRRKTAPTGSKRKSSLRIQRRSKASGAKRHMLSRDRRTGRAMKTSDRRQRSVSSKRMNRNMSRRSRR